MKHFFKYLTVPKLKLKLPSVTTEDGKRLEVAVFEAPLADSDLWDVEIESETYELRKEADPYRKGKNRTVVSKLSVNYSDLKKVIKGILKGLKLVHDEGKSHGDIRLPNILKKPGASEGKYKYSVTDFGTLKPDETGKGRKRDLENASRVLLAMWLKYLRAEDYVVQSNVINGDVDSYCESLLEGKDGVLVNRPPDYEYFGVYYPTADDKKLIEFCQRLYEGKELKSADDALADPWLR